MFQVLLKEFNGYLNSLAAYIVMVVFLVSIGLITWVFPQNSILDYGFASLDPLFNMSPYVFMFLIPAITMRTFAEEKKGGTMEFLFTRPITDFQIILGKYFASLLLVAFTLLPTLVYYYTVYELGMPKGNIDTAAVAGSYIGLFLLAAVFTAIGIFASATTDNQIIAFIIAIFIGFMLYDGFSSLAAINVWSDAAYFINQLGIDYHYASLSRGLVDIKNVIYLLSLSFLMLFATKTVLASRKW
ncbi:gliding motility-associated ABC transporter permease subunit GldF [Flammeovirgaceae bacterium SG7u.111]|nr:gliding motility-associated ABC transporter permease subunit GldF [Flammeovirgaceae bacterium SG7u.132]WPO35666.1 gliding motility-associated ABC transporter permease subunit GldF [Flammeovirgaceae bacterium SG7u.111]